MAALLFTGGDAPGDSIPPGHTVLKETAGKMENRIILDTHDWRLWNAGTVAVQSRGQIELRDLKTWAVIASQKLKPDIDRFIFEGEGPAVQKLREIVYPRALVRRIDIRQRIDTYVVRNIDEKIVCRADLLTITLTTPPEQKITGIVFTPLKGYSEETAVIEKHAGKRAREAPGRGDPLSLLLEGTALSPRLFISHKSLGLETGLPLSDASVRLLLKFTRVMEECIPGIEADIDTEFLHDFRVCIRKSRAFLSLLKSLLDIDLISPYREFLAECGKKTTPLRDLDVYLLEFPRFYSALPPSLSNYLDPFYREISAKRAAVRKDLVSYIGGDEFHDRFEKWKELLTSSDLFSSGADMDSAVLGSRLISRRYRKIRKLASFISERTSDSDLHRLRIECKKLRYCIEFFGEVVHATVVDEVLSLLKTLQDVLGEFNDMSVQQRWLQEALNSQEVLRRPGVQAAIGGLMTTLYSSQQTYRTQVYEKFNRFVDEKVSGRMHEIEPEEER